MSSEPIAIRVEGVGKCYPVYARPADRLRQFLLPRLQRLARLQTRSYFSEYWALRGASFTVRKGEQIGIVGRNGAGKSTLLQIICGTLAPTTGEVEVCGRVAALLELGAGFNPELTGRENIFLNGSVLGLSRAEIEARYDAIVAFADIPGFIDQPVKNYSSGMYMRLAFSIAVHVEPEVLVVDEALSVGDEGFQRKCLARLEALRGRGTTVLFVSHSAQTVIQLCERALWIERGAVVMDADSKQVIDAYHKSMNERPQAGALPAAPMVVRQALVLSEAVVEYPSSGGRIVSAMLSDEEGKAATWLEHGRRYYFSYRLRLDTETAGLRCGMLIKTRTGIEVAGAVVEPGDSDDATPAGCVDVEFAFTCLLFPGRYFVNCGAMALMEGEERYVHRLVDAFEIDVIHPAQRNPGGVAPQGIVDLMFSGQVAPVTTTD